jgi:hypothetical protein
MIISRWRFRRRGFFCRGIPTTTSRGAARTPWPTSGRSFVRGGRCMGVNKPVGEYRPQRGSSQTLAAQDRDRRPRIVDKAQSLARSVHGPKRPRPSHSKASEKSDDHLAAVASGVRAGEAAREQMRRQKHPRTLITPQHECENSNIASERASGRYQMATTEAFNCINSAKPKMSIRNEFLSI